MSPLSQDTVWQSVIPAKSAYGGREPGSRKRLIILNLYWIPDLDLQNGDPPE
ncbi:MAG: hypothetical protein LJE87_05595 [Deltaproteobacteria bacterium]|nr:hypothetical protein [Deltaproteobacteria bacterium]